MSQPALPVFPSPPDSSHHPIWTGCGFRVGEEIRRVLSYETGSSGWTDELTTFHEETSAGTHFIDVASREHALRTAARWMPSPHAVMMDIGCSSGYMIRDLKRRFPQALVMGADYVRGPLEKLSAAMTDVPLLQFNLVECPLPDRSIDVAVLINVLEHIEEDRAAAGQVHRILRPGGIAIVEVPAGPDLFDIYDRQLLHFRRYDARGIEKILRAAGLEIVERSHLGFFLYPFFRATKRRNQRYMNAPPEEQRRMVARAIVNSGVSVVPRTVMRVEAWLRPWISYPCGIRCLVTARKATL